MSTSKKRREARKWMQKEVERRKVLEARAREAGREDMRRDARKLLPSPDRHYHNADGGMDVVEVIKTFPSPYENAPVLRVPLPMVPVSTSRMLYGGMSMQAQYVEFRAVEHAFTVREGNSSASLRWFTWEPDRGSEESEAHTKALFKGMGKLAFASQVVRSVAELYGNRSSCSNCGALQPHVSGYHELTRASELLGECSDELRRRLGKFAPIPELSENEALYRYGYGRTG